MKKKNLFPMNEMDLKFSEILIFSNQYKILENQKKLSHALNVYLRHTLNIVPWHINWF